MAICFSVESKDHIIPIFIYSKIEKKKFSTNLLIFMILVQTANKWNFFMVFIFKFTNLATLIS